jgi:hypothetical protein
VPAHTLAAVLWFERRLVHALMEPDLDPATRARVESYVDETLRSMPEYLRAGVAAASIAFGTPVRVAHVVRPVDDEHMRELTMRWRNSSIDPLRQYVRLLQSLVLFAENEFVSAAA